VAGPKTSFSSVVRSWPWTQGAGSRPRTEARQERSVFRQPSWQLQLAGHRPIIVLPGDGHGSRRGRMVQGVLHIGQRSNEMPRTLPKRVPARTPSRLRRGVGFHRAHAIALVDIRVRPTFSGSG